jgi:hypothetical protein
MCTVVIELLRAERLDESVWDELYQSALDLSEPFDIVENMPRRCGRQTTRANHPPKLIHRVVQLVTTQ